MSHNELLDHGIGYFNFRLLLLRFASMFKSRFLAHLSWLDGQGSCNLTASLLTIWLLYCHQLQLSYDKHFRLFSRHYRLVGWALWHINTYRLLNTKSIFIQIISSISNNLVQHEYTVQLSETFLFEAI